MLPEVQELLSREVPRDIPPFTEATKFERAKQLNEWLNRWKLDAVAVFKKQIKAEISEGRDPDQRIADALERIAEALEAKESRVPLVPDSEMSLSKKPNSGVD